LRALDRFTLQIRFRRPNHGFEWWLTTNQFSAVAREVVEAYKDASNRVMENPVGTGAYRLKQWTRGQRIVLEANPDYRDVVYPAPGTGSATSDGSIARGLPAASCRWLAPSTSPSSRRRSHSFSRFDAGSSTTLQSLRACRRTSSMARHLKPDYAKRGVVLHRHVTPSVSFFYFNLDHPLVGGYTPEKIALRRAISMGYDRADAISTLAHGQASPRRSRCRPRCTDTTPNTSRLTATTLAAARALLDKFGYKDRDGDGYRELPDGKPLTIQLASTTDNAARASDELWKKDMDAIGIRITFLKNKWPELNKMSEAGQLMMWGLSWISSVPDGSDYYSYFDSKNIGTSNDARMRLPAFDALYRKSRDLPHGAGRTRLFDEMTDMIYAYAPWILATYPYENVLTQPTLKGYKQHPFVEHQWRYYDVEPRPH
jgi:ABC-type transport system substrate-binding protein